MSPPEILTAPKEPIPTKSIILDNSTTITTVVTIHLMSSVHWGPVEVLEVPQYTNEEEKAVWYDDNELEAISNDAVRTVTWISRDPERKFWDECDQTTPRGLEEMTAHGIRSRINAKLAIDAAVMQEQKRQKEQGIRDDEAIARAAKTISEPHVEKAVALGLKDQACAESIHHRHRASLISIPKRQSSHRHLMPQRQSSFRQVVARKEENSKRPRFKFGFNLRRIIGLKR